MAIGQSRALVPLSGPSGRPEAKALAQDKTASHPALDLVSEDTALRHPAEVERFLPDILGRALARCWIDASFRRGFAANPKETLAAHRIHLPDSIRIAVVTQGQTRPLVVVSEIPPYGGPERRLMHLQLVMVAGK